MRKTWELQQQTTLLSWIKPSEIELVAKSNQTPLQIISRSQLRKVANELKACLPNVNHYFAVKALPSPEALKEYANCGYGFDIASVGEIKMVANIGVSPDRMIHTHPIKRFSDVKEAYDLGLRTFVIDSLQELEVLEKYKKDVSLLLRLAFRTKDALIDLSYKFGVQVSKAVEIIDTSRMKGFNVIGLSFHAGSQLSNPQPLVYAIRESKKIINKYKDSERPLRILDIGGGFPAPYTTPVPSLKDFCAPISNELSELTEQGVSIISEVGRGVCAGAAIAVSRIMGTVEREDGLWYYLDDGIYGSYSGILFEHGDYHIWSLKEISGKNVNFIDKVTLAGPTCDSIDVIARQIIFPEMKRDEIVVSPNMGAYSWATSTTFNAFPKPTLIYID